MTATPRISIIMPTFNQARWLPAALDSIEAQTFRDYELIIVDDASTDATAKILDARPTRLERRVRARHAENRGAAVAINTGVALARGSVLAWVSSDNEMAWGWLAALVPIIDRGAGAAYGAFMKVGPGARRQRCFVAHEPGELISSENCYYGPAFLMRADVWREAGDHRGGTAHDYDHWARVEEVCARRGLPIVGVNESLCDYNAHGERTVLLRPDLYDAPRWQAEARQRRGLS